MCVIEQVCVWKCEWVCVFLKVYSYVCVRTVFISQQYLHGLVLTLPC